MVILGIIVEILEIRTRGLGTGNSNLNSVDANSGAYDFRVTCDGGYI